MQTLSKARTSPSCSMTLNVSWVEQTTQKLQETEVHMKRGGMKSALWHRISLLLTADIKSRSIVWPLFTFFRTRSWNMLRWDWTLKFISCKEHLNKWNNISLGIFKKRLLALSRQHHAMLQSGVLRVFYQFEPSWTQVMSFSVFEGSILGLSRVDQLKGWRRVHFSFWKSESWP